jgi:hypothetical protein
MNSTSQNEQAIHSTHVHVDEVRKQIGQVTEELLYRAAKHDLSKCLPPEMDIFAEYTPKLAKLTYGSEEYKECLAAMKPALDHHYSQNRHHPEFFENGVDGMNLVDLLEMLCDWIAATKRHDDGDVMKSLEINKNRFGLSDQLYNILVNTANAIIEKKFN